VPLTAPPLLQQRLQRLHGPPACTIFACTTFRPPLVTAQTAVQRTLA